MMTEKAEKIVVEVAFALPNKQSIVEVSVDDGVTAEQAVRESGIEKQFPDEDFSKLELGVFGKSVRNNHPLKNGDRVEIYRALIADPKEVRKRRAEEAKAKRAAEKAQKKQTKS